MLDNLKKVEEAKLELGEFEGKRFKIDKVEEVEVPSQYAERKKQWCLRIATKKVTEFKTDEGVKDIFASELVNLKEKDAMPSGWSSNGSLQKILDKLNVSHPKDLVGKEVVLKVRQKKREDGSKTEFLGFIY